MFFVLGLTFLCFDLRSINGFKPQGNLWTLISSASTRELTLSLPVRRSVCEGGQKEALEVEYIWEDHFSTAEKEKIKTWLDGVSGSIFRTFGAYPFTVKLYIHRANAREPVPWAETSRNGEQGVHFHVDTRFSLEDFQKDWTAAHEIAHLSIPFVGRNNMWFSEGYASYWQWQVLMEEGVYTADEIYKKYASKMKKIKSLYETGDSFLETSEKLKKSHNYPGLYWGGACYFFQVNELLKSKYNTSLKEVIRNYQSNGRLIDESLEELILSLDKVSNSKVFSEMLDNFQTGSAKNAVFPTVLPDFND